MRFAYLIYGAVALALAACGPKVPDTYLSNSMYDACGDGDLDQCQAFAAAQANGTVADRRGALIALRYACHLDHANSCADLAIMLGETTSPPRVRLAVLEQACSGGNAESCVSIGDALPAYQSKSYYQQACDASNGDGCARLAAQLRDQWRLEVHLREAFDLDSRGCEMGSSKACAAAGQALLFGSGIPADPPRGLSLIESTCTQTDGTGCLRLARMYETGTGVTQDMGRANQFYELAAIHNPDPVASTPAAAFVIYTNGCNHGDLLGCFNAGWDLAEGIDVPRNITTSRELFQRACEEGLDPACDKWSSIRPAIKVIGGER